MFIENQWLGLLNILSDFLPDFEVLFDDWSVYLGVIKLVSVSFKII